MGERGLGAYLLLDRRFIDQHDGDVIFDRVDAPALRALQALGTLPVLQRLLAGWTDKNFEQVFGNHSQYCTPHEERLAVCRSA
jgi:hypothetical protein